VTPLQEFLGDRFLEVRIEDGQQVFGVYGLSQSELDALGACGYHLVLRPVSRGDMVAAQDLAYEVLLGLWNTIGIHYPTGTVVVTVSPENMEQALALAQANPQLSAMISTAPGTPDQARLELTLGSPVSPAPETGSPEPSPTVTAVPPVLRIPKVAVTPQEVAVGGTIQIELTELDPGMKIGVVLRPVGTVLATWVSDADGKIASSVTLPSGLVAGDYVIAFVYQPEGVQGGTELATAAIKVTGAGGVATPPRSATDLPVSGSTSGAMVIAGLLILAGVGMASWRRRLAA
jgi:hypothetical protein